MKAKNLAITTSHDGTVNVSLKLVNKTDVKHLEELLNVELLELSVKKYRKKRSLTSNAYAWLLLDKLADKLQTTKEELYQHSIKMVGKFEMVPIKKEAVQDFIKAWEGQGLGNIAEDIRESTFDGYEVIRAYYGSSTYDSKDMARLIDYIVEECKTQGIETMPPDELERLIHGN